MTLKRLFDILVAGLALLVLSPLLLLIALMVAIKLGWPVLFRQVRPGLNGQPFTIYKFRTMTNACDANGELLPVEQRITPLGQWLRRTSLDELPELWNVLSGDMSLVGPRPLLMEYLPRYSPEQMRRHAVLPGITGWAQVNGRNNLPFEQRFELDVWYVDHHTFWLDLEILWRTVWIVLGRKDVNREGYVDGGELFAGSPRP